MKTYSSKPNEDLGSIASKFGMPSWKYLYEQNKDAIGDNPDLLKEGTKLKIPQWDSTGGDEKIKAKDADPMAYTGGASYRYPWVAFSYSVIHEEQGTNDTQEYKPKKYSKSRKYCLKEGNTKEIIASGEINASDEIEALIPDVKDGMLFIDDIEYSLNTRK